MSMIIENADMQAGNGRYKQVKISVDPEIASAFKASCAASNISMAAVLSKFMADYSKSKVAKKPSPDYTTRRKRVAAARFYAKQFELIRDSEERYRDNIPENLQGSVVYDRADEFASLLDDVVDLLSQV